MALWKNGRFVSDPWYYVREGEDASPAGHVIPGLDWWTNMRDVFLPSNAPVGIRIEAGEDLRSIIGDLHRFSLVALVFPAYTDGRSFSKAQLLRDRYGFRGEVRAVGDVLIDQFSMLLRSGFDAFEITDEASMKALEDGAYWTQSRFYQPSVLEEPHAGGRPWLRAASSA
ncbi:MAG: DUF934 domain-containing protein [Beijerinckiaceae bacterium]|jgi:uncharacterized protein (DUF934 family)|nr:DUF934 domain-containing protein [Beijerinckiaceae bacterium]